MITLDSTHPTTREAGVVYTKPWMVELVLDLAGYLLEKRLAVMVALESFGGTGRAFSLRPRHQLQHPASTPRDQCQTLNYKLTTAK